MKRFLAFVAAAALVFVLAACGQPAPAPDPDPEPQSIAEIATEAGIFETLLSILPEELSAALSDDEAGPSTVFAPTEDAFDALPEGTLAALLGDIPALTNILQYHVFDGVLMASDVLDAIDAGGGSASVTTLQGSDIVATVVDGGVVLNGEVNVIITDIVASNGVIHVIDAVLLPEEDDRARTPILATPLTIHDAFNCACSVGRPSTASEGRPASCATRWEP